MSDAPSIRQYLAMRADRTALLHLGLDIATRIREDDVAQVATLLDGLSTEQLRDLTLILAACVDVTRPVADVIAWTGQTTLPRRPRPWKACGTPEAYRRHKARGEVPDTACEVAFRAWDAARKRQGRRAS